ncbi:MAG: universal stress protein [Candidatus Thermoplasmatota archaeon]|nr:universal stress protein [Candidatus Thermoplasmatota archaeon]
MFERILIAISSEFYTKEALRQGAMLAQRCRSMVSIVYIIEEKTLAQAQRRSDAFRTRFEKEETKKRIIEGQQQTANVIIFFDAKTIFKQTGITPNFKIVEGEFSTVIEQEVQTQRFDVVFIGYSEEGLLRYRILDETAVPLWVVGESKGSCVLGVCSNLTPNQRVLSVSKELAACLGWKLELMYMVDVTEPIAYDETMQRFVKRSIPQLLAEGQRYVEEMQKNGVSMQLVTGAFVDLLVQNTHRLHAGLVVVGQEKRRFDRLGLPVRSMNQRLVEKLRVSVLFLQ